MLKFKDIFFIHIPRFVLLKNIQFLIIIISSQNESWLIKSKNKYSQFL